MRILSTLTIALLLFVLWQYHTSVVQYQEVLPGLERASEAFLAGGITGRQVPPRYLEWMDGQSGRTEDHEGWRALWVVDVEQCLGCLSDVRSWNQLTGHGVTPTLILSGVTQLEAQTLAEGGGITTPVAADPQSISRTTFGFELSSLRLLVHADGTILHVDARHPTACFWDFPTLVERLVDPSSRTPVVPLDDPRLPDAILLGGP